jgi:hypothetical protein
MRLTFAISVFSLSIAFASLLPERTHAVSITYGNDGRISFGKVKYVIGDREGEAFGLCRKNDKVGKLNFL